MMKVRILALVICLSLAAAAAMAHGGEEHVMGTVSKVAANSITVQTGAKTFVTVAVVAATTFTDTKVMAAAKIADLKIGDRVVIHAKEPVEGKLEADTVEFSAPKPAAPSHTQTAMPAKQ
jgi:hypothetical protein